MPKTIQETIDIDTNNGKHLWWEAICAEMKNVRVAFEAFEGDATTLPNKFSDVK